MWFWSRYGDAERCERHRGVRETSPCAGSLAGGNGVRSRSGARWLNPRRDERRDGHALGEQPSELIEGAPRVVQSVVRGAAAIAERAATVAAEQAKPRSLAALHEAVPHDTERAHARMRGAVGERADALGGGAHEEESGAPSVRGARMEGPDPIRRPTSARRWAGDGCGGSDHSSRRIRPRAQQRSAAVRGGENDISLDGTRARRCPLSAAIRGLCSGRRRSLAQPVRRRRSVRMSP